MARERCNDPGCECCNREEKTLLDKIFNEKVLMCLAVGGALSLGKFGEAIAVVVLYIIGQIFEDRAVSKARRNIRELMDIRPDRTYIMDDDEMIAVDPALLKVGATIYVLPGEKIPMDGKLIGVIGEGRKVIEKNISAKLDTAALTGESKAREANIGDELLSGMINIAGSNAEILKAKETGETLIPGTLVIEVTKAFEESTATKVLELVENAADKKAKSEDFIKKFARIYTPIVFGLAVLLTLVPGLITKDWGTWFYRSLTFLVISCPCALVISVPLSFFAGIGGASKSGILIKGANYIETLAKVRTVAFDKTGTLTVGTVDQVDHLKQTTPDAISSLKKIGIRYTIMLTGDKKDIAENIGREAGVDSVLSELLPVDKVTSVERLLADNKKGETLAYVGDGINDAPCLMRADCGIAMGALGTDAAIEAADVVLMDDDPRKVAQAILIARKCIRIVNENIYFAIGVKVVCLILGALGIANMWLAIFADVGVMVLAVLNAMRALRVNNKQKEKICLN